MANDVLLISREDFEGVKQVAEHVSYDNLTPFIRERQDSELKRKLGRVMYYDLLNNYTSTEYKALLDGAVYQDADSNDLFHRGLRHCLVYWAYAAYIMDSAVIDTPYGARKKSGMDGMPVEINEIRNISSRNQRVGNDYWEDDYPKYEGNCSDLSKSPQVSAVRATRMKFLTPDSLTSNTDCSDDTPCE